MSGDLYAVPFRPKPWCEATIGSSAVPCLPLYNDGFERIKSRNGLERKALIFGYGVIAYTHKADIHPLPIVWIGFHLQTHEAVYF